VQVREGGGPLVQVREGEAAGPLVQVREGRGPTHNLDKNTS
jgi:hypothetical protein